MSLIDGMIGMNSSMKLALGMRKDPIVPGYVGQIWVPRTPSM